MAKAKKLPSGSWRVRVYSHTENGKKIQESFTAPTKAEAEMLAAQFAANKHRRARHDLTVAEAIDGYVKSKDGVLSPATIRGYVRMQDNNFAPINVRRIRTLTTEDIQSFISDLSKEKSAKTVKNVYSLLRASIGLYEPSFRFAITLPALPKKRPVSPDNDAIKELYRKAPPALKVCIGFGMCGLREGEVSALRYEDITDGVAHVHSVFVKDKDRNWILKDVPKTSGSDRFVPLPDSLVDLIGEGEGYITNMNPATISKKFTVLRDSLKLKVRFHDLRHFFASTASVLGIPDIYTADMGGWERNSPVMKSIYQNNITSMSSYYARKMKSHLNKLMEDA